MTDLRALGKGLAQRHIADCHRLFLHDGNPAHAWEAFETHRKMCAGDPLPQWILDALQANVSRRNRGKADTAWQTVERIKTIGALQALSRNLHRDNPEKFPEKTLDSILHLVAERDHLSYEHVRREWYDFLKKRPDLR
jgi:hypothetical protein